MVFVPIKKIYLKCAYNYIVVLNNFDIVIIFNGDKRPSVIYNKPYIGNNHFVTVKNIFN